MPGDYRGIVKELTGRFIELEPAYEGDDKSWYLTTNTSFPDVEVEVGDEVIVEVEFNNYTATSVRHVHLNARALNVRLTALEARMDACTCTPKP
jgi:hypothetical protein